MGKLAISFGSVIIFLYITREVFANNGAGNKPPGPDSPFWAARGRRSDKELSVNPFDDILPSGMLQEIDSHSKSDPIPWLNTGAARGDSIPEDSAMGRRLSWPGNGFNYFSQPKLDDLSKLMWTSWKKKSGPPDTPIDPFWAARG